MNNFESTSSRKNPLFDTLNLRIEANYEIEVESDVFWVPVNQLGISKYTSEDIKRILPMTPEEKQAKISTLYEAIQLYQASNFRGVIDNVKHVEKNLCWNYHKPGYHAVRTNEGCCASNSNWLSYLLHDKYEQIGFIHYSQRNGNGHVMNYIFHDGWYYFIDMMMYRSDSLPFAGIESGTIDGYKDNEPIGGKFFKSKVPSSYVNFCLKKHEDAPILFTISPEKEVFAMAGDGVPNCFNIIHPCGTKIITLYKEKDFNLNIKFRKPFDCELKWEDIPTEKYHIQY